MSVVRPVLSALFPVLPIAIASVELESPPPYQKAIEHVELSVGHVLQAASDIEDSFDSNESVDHFDELDSSFDDSYSRVVADVRSEFSERLPAFSDREISVEELDDDLDIDLDELDGQLALRDFSSSNLKGFSSSTKIVGAEGSIIEGLSTSNSISPTVGQAIERAMTKPDTKSVVRVAMAAPKRRAKAPVQTRPTDAYREDRKKAQINHNFDLSLTAESVSSEGVKDLGYFELRWQDDEGKRESQDSTDGHVDVELALLKNGNRRAFKVVPSPGHLRTNHMLVAYAEGGVELKLPVFSESFVSRFGDYDGTLGHLLVDFDPSRKVDLVDDYHKKVFLNESFQVVEQGQGPRYALFTGVEPGNTTMVFSSNGKDLGSYVAPVYANELSFELISLEGRKTEIAFKEESALSNTPLESFIKEEDLELVGAKVKFTKEALGRFSFMAYPDAYSRIYLNYKSQGESIGLGLNFDGKKRKAVSIPDQSFRDALLGPGKLNLGELGKACLIQVNLPKNEMYSSVDILQSIPSGEEVQYPEHYFLDKDGELYEAPGMDTQKLIILGQYYGPVSVRLRSANSNRFFTTFCLPETYLVEQF